MTDREHDWGAGLHDVPQALHTTPEMRRIFEGPERVRRMFAFEAALARAESRAGLVPPEVAERIASAAEDPRDLDLTGLSEQARVSGVITVPVIAALRERVDDEARRYVHLGATSQDLVDTVMVLQAREALGVLIDDLLAIGDACAELASRHAATPMIGRTLMQQAIPITFGLKAAQWLAAADGQARRLADLVDRELALQFGGAAGTLASLGEDGPRVAELLGEELDLPVPDLPWHSDRSRVATVGSALAVTAGAMAKIGYDVVLLMQNEVAEAVEDAAGGKGRSSAMPHKRNPTETLATLASQRLAHGHVTTLLGGMTIEHERSVGSWQTEWTTVPALFEVTGSAVAGIRATLAGLDVRADRMRATIDAAGGLPMAESLARALTPALGAEEAHHIVSELSERAVAAGAHLADAAAEDTRVTAHLPDEALATALDPLSYRGSADVFVERALSGHRRTREALRRS
ncbi:3-carboxy-cis,cis-muconate cycloisomerase [Egibacter rhizosphaerae]|uniref:3-carboxy-cis,cis-muconate cycloisomerase n=1 Tax=Egibacter rhizosphaerae TaxID=1670831 RepID=A0A411YHA5_9ACTN|nr:3-carboxy-cis,cis-muconate cycloisomerase [Egibacter rhizosphaerae]QBI20501.1 3-carboxy-cis,cis-muconate cycloisomerase [Egibacter rhizosphaerae]